MEHRQINQTTLEVKDSKGRVFLISPCDVSLIKNHVWYVSKIGYVERKVSRTNTTRRLHQDILPNAKMVDHVNGNRSDNRRENLRTCNKSQNAINTGLPKNNKYGVKGIIVRNEPNYKGRNIYRVSLVKNHVRYNLGTYRGLEQAKQARLKAEAQYYGEWRRAE